MMKILALAPRPLLPGHDGGSVATARCLRGLAEAGAEVSLLAMRTEKHRRPLPGSNDDTGAYLSRYTEVEADTRIRASGLLTNLLFSGEPYDLSRFRSKSYGSALRSILEAGSYDIIHCEGLAMALYLKQIKELTSAPAVLRAHNLEHRIREMMAAGPGSPVRKAYLSILARRLLVMERDAARQFDAVVPISRDDSLWFSAVAPGKPLFVCETGTEEARQMPEPEGNGIRVGFIGSMDWEPNIAGIKWFIEAVWPLIAAKIPGASLHLAGKGIYGAAGRLPSGHNIHIEGEPDDARMFIASNHLMISPLFAGSGMRIKIIESLSTGRAVVATPEAVAGLIMTEGNGVTVAADAVSFGNAVVRLLEDPSLRAAASTDAVRMVSERYNNRILTSGLMEFYKKLSHGS
jgi:glycosyltransferase involved in cell wall biosynthesis